MRHEEYMRLAIEKTRDGIKNGQTPFGACIVRGNEVVCTAHNQVWAHTDITAHAEIQALRAACQKLHTIDLNDCVLYSTCEPCPMCFSAIHWARIKTVFFGAAIEDAKIAGFNELSISNEQMKQLGGSTVEIHRGLMAEENRQLFQEWLRSPQKRVY